MFRENALKSKGHFNPKWYLDTPLTSRNWLIAIWIGVLTGIICFGSTIPFAKKEKVRGFISPTHGIVQLYPRSQARVERIHVLTNQLVRKNQLLITMNSPVTTDSGEQFTNKLARFLDRRLDLINHIYELNTRQIENQGSQDRKNAEFLRTQLDNFEKSINLQKSVLADLNQQKKHIGLLLEKRLTSNFALSELHAQIAREHQILNQLQQQQMQTRLDLERFRQTDRDNKIQLETSESLLMERYLSLMSDRQRLYTQGRQEIRSPVDGRIIHMRTWEGDESPGVRPLIDILPSDSNLEISLMVPDRAIGFIRKGQKIKVSLDAYPQRHFGSLDASVTFITSSVQLPGESRIPLVAMSPAFLVKASIDHDAINRPLKPDMLLTAYIKLEDRSLLQWVIASLKGRS